jgi:putative ABC transport system substrate-binding protein
MNRRAFISALGGAVVCPMTTRAQQRSRIRRVGVLSGNRATDPELESRRAALEGVLQEQGWVIGRDIEIQYRWGGGDTELTRAYAKELVAMQPDVIFAGTNTSMAALHRNAVCR